MSIRVDKVDDTLHLYIHYNMEQRVSLIEVVYKDINLGVQAKELRSTSALRVCELWLSSGDAYAGLHLTEFAEKIGIPIM